MKQNHTEFYLDIGVKLGQFLLSGGLLNKVQSLLCQHAPKWITKLRVYRHREQSTPIDVFVPGALENAVRELGLEHGPLYYEIMRRFGAGIPERLSGSGEIHGASNALIIVPNFDERIIHPMSDFWILGNKISFQICKPKVDGVDSVTWAHQMFSALCEELSPWYAYSQMSEEYDHKNISHEGGGVAAIGVDVSKYLPGIYWLNFFGKPYRDLIGRERLLSAPAHEIAEINDGVLLGLHADPRAWKTPEYQLTEQRVVAHVGPQFFFSRDDTTRKTIAPDWSKWTTGGLGETKGTRTNAINLRTEGHR